jgi:hypothetical protein
MWMAPLWEYFWIVLYVLDCPMCDVNATLYFGLCNLQVLTSLCYQCKSYVILDLCKFYVILDYLNVSLVNLLVLSRI